MALVKPIALSQKAFDATTVQTFLFNSSGGSQVVKNRLTIRDNITNVIVYQQIYTSYKFEHPLPANSLQNGKYYNYYINTYDVNDNMSEDSNVMPFYCFSQPTLTFSNISDSATVNNASFTFSLTYAQTQGELLEYAIISLYSASGTFIADSGNLYSNQAPPLTLSYTYEGLENNNFYYVKANGVTTNGTIIESSIVNFYVEYTEPELYSNMVLTNNCKDGYMQISSSVITLGGITDIVPPIYIKQFPSGLDINDYIQWDTTYQAPDSGLISYWLDKKKLDIRNPYNYVKWDSGYSIPSTFLVRIWINPTFIYNFLQFGDSTNGYVANFVREIPFGETTQKDYFELKGYVNGVLKVYQRSNYVDIMNTNDYVFIWIKKVNSTYELILDVLERGTNSHIEWGGYGNSNVDFNTLTDLDWAYETKPIGIEPILLNGNMEEIFPITKTELSSGIYDNFDVSKNLDISFTTVLPVWDTHTVLNCDFNGNVNAGNVEFEAQQLNSVKVKRRKLGEFNWVTLLNKKINSSGDLSVYYLDSFVPTNETFQWAIVPMLENGVEGDYIIQSATTNFNGVFVSNGEKIFKLYNMVQYGSGRQNVSVGKLQPIGSQYPTIIQNSNVNYYSNEITATLCGYDFEETRKIDRKDVVKQVNDFIEFLTSGTGYVIKDWNGNIWVGKTDGIPSVSYNSSYGNGVATVTFSFSEQGKYDVQKDLYRNGLVDIL